jgi:endonuclease YncB( thermonuclease family)
MTQFERINAYRPARRGGRRWAARVLPWIFVAAVVAVSTLPVRRWVDLPWSHPVESQAARDADTIVKRSASSDTRHRVDVVRTIDGDTFEARVHLEPGLDLTTRVRLRGIDAPELKAACAEELQMAEAATAALRALLGEGGVAISNVGADKYDGRIVADVSTRRIANVSAAMLGGGYVRRYGGGHRNGWCAATSEALPK